jgi:hypothetical protein
MAVCYGRAGRVTAKNGGFRSGQRHKRLDVLAASVLLGLGTEYAAIRAGGTHCHNQGAVNFAQCSSANSVFYYGTRAGSF